MKRKLSNNYLLIALLAAVAVCASLFIIPGHAQKGNAKKGFKIVNNEAIAEDGFEIVRVSDKEGHIVKSKSPRTHSEDTTLGPVTINCTCTTKSDLIVKCPIIIGRFRAKCGTEQLCGGNKCVMTAQ